MITNATFIIKLKIRTTNIWPITKIVISFFNKKL